MPGLKVATWNVGMGSLADAREVMRDVSAMALQEAGDQARLVNALAEDGHVVIRPKEFLGQPATPLIYKPTELRYIRPLQQLMVAGGDIGPGTGPDTVKPKYLIGGYFIHLASRRRVALASTHRFAGQRVGNERYERATVHARRVVDALADYTGVPVVMGDWNSVPDSDTLAPLRRAGWTCDQLEGKRLPTHGGWVPDHVWWRKDERIAFDSHHTIKNGSDHNALIVSFDLKEKRR